MEMLSQCGRVVFFGPSGGSPSVSLALDSGRFRDQAASVQRYAHNARPGTQGSRVASTSMPCPLCVRASGCIVMNAE